MMPQLTKQLFFAAAASSPPPHFYYLAIAFIRGPLCSMSSETNVYPLELRKPLIKQSHGKYSLLPHIAKMMKKIPKCFGISHSYALLQKCFSRITFACYTSHALPSSFLISMPVQLGKRNGSWSGLWILHWNSQHPTSTMYKVNIS